MNTPTPARPALEALMDDVDELRAHFEDRADITDNGGPNFAMKAEVIPNPTCLPEINHRDGVKSNNAAPNLEWCSRSIGRYKNSAAERGQASRRCRGGSFDVLDFVGLARDLVHQRQDLLARRVFAE